MFRGFLGGWEEGLNVIVLGVLLSFEHVLTTDSRVLFCWKQYSLMI